MLCCQPCKVCCACRHFCSNTGPQIFLARMMKFTAKKFCDELKQWKAAPAAVRSCSMILPGCPQYFCHKAGCPPVGFLHQVLPADVERIDTVDSHTPKSDTLHSVGQDNRHKLDTLGDLSKYMMDRQAELPQQWNEVCAHVNGQTVIGLLCSTDYVRKSFNSNIQCEGHAFLVRLQKSGILPDLPIFTWDALSGRLFQ